MRRKYPFSVSELATEAGVSPATVSRVLNNRELTQSEARNRVCSALQARGINPDDIILDSPKSSGLILFSLPFDFNSFFNEIIKGSKASALQHGYRLLIRQEHINENTFPRFETDIRELGIAGLICLDHLEGGRLERISSMLPMVQCCDYDPQNPSVSSVSLDDEKMGCAATDYLISLGCRRIAFLSGQLRYRDNLERRNGYVRSLTTHGFEPLPSRIISLPEIDYNMAFSTATQLLSQPNRPDGFLAISDLFACAITNAAHRLGLHVPRDVKVIGYDNVDYSIMSSPTITTVNTPKFQMGYTACELVIERIQNPENPGRHISLPSELVIRESTAIL